MQDLLLWFKWCKTSNQFHCKVGTHNLQKRAILHCSGYRSRPRISPTYRPTGNPELVLGWKCKFDQKHRKNIGTVQKHWMGWSIQTACWQCKTQRERLRSRSPPLLSSAMKQHTGEDVFHNRPGGHVGLLHWKNVYSVNGTHIHPLPHTALWLCCNVKHTHTRTHTVLPSNSGIPVTRTVPLSLLTHTEAGCGNGGRKVPWCWNQV